MTPALTEDDGAGVRRMSYELTPSEHDDDNHHAHEVGEQWEGRVRARKSRSRLLALAAVCTMSIGSHFAMHLLGPLKSRLHREMNTTNSQFSLLIAASNLNSTWTPLVAGLLVARFGTAGSSVATTGCILLGQLILLFGVTTGHLVTMANGLFIFGLGLTPLAVVQETLLARLSPGGHRHLGLSLALGLVSGKASSFVSSLVSLPLADRYGDAVPFGLTVLLCAGGFVANGARLLLGWGKEVGEAEVSEKRKVGWGGVGRLGDVFWLYILMNILSGAIWSPFIHLSANLVQTRYDISETLASRFAAILLCGAIVLYPITGLITDRLDPSNPRTTIRLFILSSILTLLAYTYLLLPPSITYSPWPGMTLFTMGNGMSTLLMVILVPRLLPPELVPLGLGLHKSLESASASVAQTLAGVYLDHARGAHGEFQAGQGLLTGFWVVNCLQLACAGMLWVIEKRKRARITIAAQYEELPRLSIDRIDEQQEGESDLDLDLDLDLDSGVGLDSDMEPELPPEVKVEKVSSGLAMTDGEKRRSKTCFGSAIAWVGVSWVLFMGTAWSKL